MNFQQVMLLIGRWAGTLRFFPSDPEARIGIAEELAEMASNEEQIRWLVKRLPKLFTEWPAMHEVRAVFCSKFRPKDGIEVYSGVYLDGIPAEKEDGLKQIEDPKARQIEGPVSADAEMCLIVHKTAVARSMPPIKPTVVPEHGNELQELLKQLDADRARKEKPLLPTEAEIELVKRKQRENLVAKWGICQACFMPHDPGSRCVVGEVAQ
jgi:hypothetical protein